MSKKELRDCKEINFTIPEEKNGSDLEDFSTAGVPPTPARENRQEMNRFFPRELQKLFSYSP